MLPSFYQAGTLFRYAAASGSKLTANNGTAVITINEASGYITFAASATYAAGKYRYIITDSDSVINESGLFEVLPSLASGNGLTANQITLAAIDAVIAGRATQNQLSVSVGDKSIRYLTPSELFEMRGYYADLVDSELAAISGVNNQSYVVRFNTP